jgi:hypothetical protein
VVEVEAWIYKVLDLGVIPTPSADPVPLRRGPVPLRRGIANVRVNTLGPIFAAFTILSFHYARDLVHGLGVVAVSHGMPTHPRMPKGRGETRF